MNERGANSSSVTDELSTYIAAALRKLPPEDVAAKTKHHVLDTIAAMVSGSRLLAGRKASAYIKARGGVEEAGVVGSRVVTSAENAGMANAMLAHADETDDSHQPSQTHPGCGIVAAALAVGEREGRDGNAFLRAVALGYDISCRLMFALNAPAFREEGHATHAFGPLFGAAAAAGALLKLSP